MSPTTKFNLGDCVIPSDGKYPGTVIDITATASGKWIYAVENSDGRVTHFTENGLTSQG